MIHKRSLQTWLSLVVVILLASTLAGCAAKRELRKEPETGMTLRYRMPEDQVLKYRTSSEYTQNMEVMNQPMKAEVNTETAFSVRSKGLDADDYQLEVTVDSMSANIVTPEGEISPDMSTVNGESFDMILSPSGKELDLSRAESIQYDLGAQGKRSIAPDFQAIFPDLADRPVTIGDTWPAKWNVTDTSSNGETGIDFESVNTLEGFETVNGLECVRMKAAVTGILGGKGEQEGMKISSEGEIKAIGTWYFAHKEGIFVRMITEGAGEITIAVSGGPRDMTIPVTREFKIKTELIR